MQFDTSKVLERPLNPSGVWGVLFWDPIYLQGLCGDLGGGFGGRVARFLGTQGCRTGSLGASRNCLDEKWELPKIAEKLSGLLQELTLSYYNIGETILLTIYMCIYMYMSVVI